MNSTDFPLPVIELYNGSVRRDMVDWTIAHADSDEWVPKGDIVDDLDCAGESVRKSLPVLIQFGLLDVNDPDVQIKHYRPANTDVMDILTEWDGYPLTDLLEYTATQNLVEFFLDRADPSESYTKTALQDQSDAGYQGINNHLDTLVEAGVVEEVEGNRSTEYQLNRDAEIVKTLYELNEALLHCYRERP
jgi:hypothetical protein